ncbi:hypothetical protein JX265_003705 [Neoarthrinium moseri]|uniref:Heterokaryon incompatibility domain-containing protein n=2 Tax=Neoarthrinium moseri TaxID=1658444 RepID=A0A9Q0APH6_9PEZI|nr:hypothetical protein JX265_003705 [Neoarthrinium moseri]
MAEAAAAGADSPDASDGTSFHSALPAPAVPVIELPHRWDHEGNLIAASYPENCPRCLWTGDPRDLLVVEDSTKLSGLVAEDAAPVTCASCQLAAVIWRRVAVQRQKTITDRDCMIAHPQGHYSFSFRGDPVTHWQTIFTPLDLHRTQLTNYDIPRRTWAHLESLFHASADWASRRISECLASHPSCRQSEPGGYFLPSRLIDVESQQLQDGVVLTESSAIPSDSRYVALSYCWGDYKPPCITTPSTLHQNKQRIPWSTLPATFQDAVRFTRIIGVKYLWIDGICIVQGDQADWSREAGRMLPTYRNAYVTLAAVYGHSSTSGLRSQSMEDQSIRVAELALDQASCPLYMRRYHYLTGVARDDTTNDPDLKDWGPLFSRAWAYQERLTSPRVLYFTASEIIFQCFGSVACECSATEQEIRGDWSLMGLAKSQFFSLVVDTQSSSTANGPDDLDADTRQRRIQESWRSDIVTDYSRLDLTLSTDKLPALAAIAEQYQRARPGETYLAGLWSGSLLADLLWICKPLGLDMSRKEKALCRSSSLPTWTWASMKGGVYYLQKGDSTVTSLAEVVEAKCEFADENPFSTLISSSIVILGRLLPCDLTYETHVGHHRWVFWYLTSTIIREVSDLRDVYMDHDQQQWKDYRRRVCILEVLRVENFKRYFLIICRTSGNEHFTRIGFLSYHGQMRQQPHNFWGVFEASSFTTECELR